MALDNQPEFLKDIDIVDLISEYVTLRRHGREFQGLCPFHSERTPSFSVNPEKGFWYCHGCHEGGDKVSFLAKIEGIGRGQAIRQLAERQGVTLSGSGGAGAIHDEAHRDRLLAAAAAAARFYSENILADDALPARTYLRSRGIDRSCAAAFDLGYAPQSADALWQQLLKLGFTLEEAEEAGLCSRGEFGPYDRMRHRLIIPVADAQGRVIAFGGRALGDASPKYLNSPETALFHKSRTLYLLHRARRAIQQQGSVVVVEGYFDALIAHHYGVENVVATLGTAITADHAQVFRRLAKQVILALDADAAGTRAVERTAPLFEDTGIAVAVAGFPAGMDPDAFIRSFGADQFRERLKAAVGVVEFRLATLLRNSNISTPEGKTTAIQECTKILGTVRSPLLRDRYVDDLARLWVGAQAPGNSLLDNIEVIRDEVARRVRQSLGSGRRTVSHRLAETTVQGPALETDEARAEVGLLAALLKKPLLAARVPDIVAPSELRTPEHRAILDLILDRCPGEDLLGRLPDESSRQAAVKALAASEALTDDDMALQQVFLDCLRKVRDFDRRVRVEELRRKINAMVSGIPAAIADEEIQEYHQLVLYFKGVSDPEAPSFF